MPSERSASSTSFLYSPVSGRPVHNLRHRCPHHLSRIILQIQPVVPHIIRLNHRHPVVNECNALRRFSREDASVEINEHPELKGKPIAVCGSTENRHGIVLTASYPAKRMGVKTAMANWQAKQACPNLIYVPPNYELYIKYSRLVRRIYQRYSNDVEPFGMDESWISIHFA